MKQNLTLILLIVLLASVSYFGYDWTCKRPLRSERKRDFVVVKTDLTPEDDAQDPTL